MLLEKHDKDQSKSLSSRDNPLDRCYDNDNVVDDDEDSALEDADLEEEENDDDRERLRKKDKYNAHSAIYKSLRKMMPEPESLSPPPPVPQSTNEMIMQRDKQLYYDGGGGGTRKRYHTSPHDKHRVSQRIYSYDAYSNFFKLT